jgi:hypothetical protein
MTDNNEKNNWPVWATEPVEIKDYNPNWKEKGLTLKKELYMLYIGAQKGGYELRLYLLRR